MLGVDPPAAGEVEIPITRHDRPKSSKPDPTDNTEEAKSAEETERASREEAENKAAMERERARQEEKKREASTQKGPKHRAASKKKTKSKFRQDNKAPSAARHRADEAYFDNVHKDASIPLRPPNVHVSDEDDDSINIEGADMSMGMESGDEEMNQQYSTNRVNGEANKMRKVE